jgi:hypothetical protein
MLDRCRSFDTLQVSCRRRQAAERTHGERMLRGESCPRPRPASLCVGKSHTATRPHGCGFSNTPAVDSPIATGRVARIGHILISGLFFPPTATAPCPSHPALLLALHDFHPPPHLNFDELRRSETLWSNAVLLAHDLGSPPRRKSKCATTMAIEVPCRP